MERTIIALSREYCTGGIGIARQVAETLGVPFYDKELITLAAKESGLSEEAVAASEKRRTGSLLYGLYTMGADLPLSDQVYIIQSKVIQSLAEKGPCVIVGRCADYVLRDDERLLSVFLHAPADYRRKRGLAQKQLPADLDDRALEALIEKEDKRRAGYYNYYTEYRWGAAEHYDLCLNAELGPELCAGLILQATGRK